MMGTCDRLLVSTKECRVTQGFLRKYVSFWLPWRGCTTSTGFAEHMQVVRQGVRKLRLGCVQKHVMLPLQMLPDCAAWAGLASLQKL